MKNKQIIITLIAFLLALILPSCGTSDLAKSLSAEERFELGKKKFENKDFLDAMGEFEIVKLQYPGSSIADDAQFHLAECRFNQEEYLLAAQEFQELRRNFPASSLVAAAQYKIGLCYYMLTPRSSLDQQYTLRAIDDFQAFIEYYPAHELAQDASLKIKELNNKLAKKLYDTAELYMIMEYFKSATIYFNNIVEKFHDTEFAEPALLGKVKSLVYRNKFNDARQELDKFFEKYPNSSLKNDAESLRADLKNNPGPAPVNKK